MNGKGIKVHEEKFTNEVKSFHGLASYRRFIRYFSTLATPSIELVERIVGFEWKGEQKRSFEFLKERLIFTPLLILPNFSKMFEIEYDAFGICIEFEFKVGY